MANKIKLTIQVNDDGSLGIVGKKAREAAAATDKLDKSSKNYNKTQQKSYRTQQGAAHTSSNLTKNFAKQSQGISGGLVPAYAALAANIFAVTALFGALQRAAQVQQLTSGITALGQASGIAMNTLARDLQAVTGNALALEDAMRATALTISSGFDSSTLAELGEVARNASIALGRDTTDSLNRLVRGATKLEPELLDELGIMVRLDEAARDYARGINKTVSELTLAEKRQAFMNAVLEEGETKFKAIGEAVDTNPYDKLAASFSDLTKTILGFVNSALAPLVNFLAESTAALVGGLTILGSTVLKSVAPGVSDIATRYEDLIEASNGTSESTVRFMSNLKGVPKKFQTLAAGLENSSDKAGDLRGMIKSADSSIKSFKDKMDNTELSLAKMSAQNARSTEGIRRSTKARNAAIVALRTQAGAEVLLQEAQIAGLITTGSFKDAFSQIPQLMKGIDAQYKATAISGGILGKVNTFLGASFAKLATYVRLLGLAFLQALPVIGASVVALAALAGAAVGIRKLMLESQGLTEINAKLNKSTEKLKETTEENTPIIKNIIDAREGESDTIKTQSQLIEAHANVVSIQTAAYEEQLEVLKELGDRRLIGDGEARRAVLESILLQASLNDELNENLQIQLKEAGILHRSGQIRSVTNEAVQTAITLFQSLSVENDKLVKKQNDFRESLKNAQKPLSDFQNTLSVKTPYDDASQALTDVRQNLKDLNELAGDDTAISENLRMIAEAATGGLGDTFTEGIREKLRAIRETDLGAALMGGDAEAARILNQELTEQINRRQHLVDLAQQFAQETKGIVAYHTNQAKILEKINYSESTANKLVDHKNAAIQQQIDQLDNTLALRAEENGEIADSYGFIMQTFEIEEKRAALAEQLINTEERKQAIATANLQRIQLEQKGQQALLQIQSTLNANKAATLALDELNLRNAAKASSAAAGRGFVVTAEQELDISAKMFSAREAAILAEEDIRNKTIAMEYTLLDAQLKAQKAEIEVVNARHRQAVEEDRMNRGATGEMGLPIADIVNIDFVDQALEQVGAARLAAFEQNGTQTAQKLAELDQQLVEQGAEARVTAFTRVAKEAEARLVAEQAGERAQLDLAKKLADSNDKIIESKKEQLEREARQQSLENPNIRKEIITAAQRAKIESDLSESRQEAIKEEERIQLTMIELEYALLEAKLTAARDEAVIRAQMDPNLDAEKIGNSFDAAIGLVTGARTKAEDAVKLDTENRINNVIDGVAQASRDAVAKAAGKTTGETGNTTGPFASVGAQAESVGNMFTEGTGEFSEKLSDRVGAVAKFGSELQGVFNQFGPENPMMTAALEGAINMSAAWGSAFESIKTEGGITKENLGQVFGAIGSTIGAIAGMQKAASQQRIAGIDQEIAAEKKRDGKSAQSVAKIKALEKKKEAEKRKAFERDKKMQMAQVVMGTASAIVSAMQTQPFVPAGLIMAGVAAAMGAAQLSMISGMSYQGGGAGAPSAGGPSAISLGSRSNVVDMASSRSSRGELAYMRGESGSGGPESFKPAFAGARYRAAGGETAGYVVGEQGPELFVPNAPGTIVPNDDMPTGAPVNATFNINTIDASGVEDILVTQRGNIIGMIREGANSYGQGFLEEVDTSIYTPSAGGVSRY